MNTPPVRQARAVMTIMTLALPSHIPAHILIGRILRVEIEEGVQADAACDQGKDTDRAGCAPLEGVALIFGGLLYSKAHASLPPSLAPRVPPFSLLALPGYPSPASRRI